MSNTSWMNRCRVCGLDHGEPIWGETGHSPNYGICACCGTEFGYNDCTLEEIRERRAKWLSNVEQWRWPKDKPVNWDYKEQMKNIPKQYL